MAEEKGYKRVMPHHPEAERSVIGAMLLDRSAIETAAEFISGEDFYNRQLGIYFDAMQELNRQNKEVDPVTLQDKLRMQNLPPEFISATYINDLVQGVPTSANVKYYAKIVAEHATRRKLIRISEDVMNDCYGGQKELEGLLEEAEKKIFEVSEHGRSAEFVPISEIVLEDLNRMVKASKNKGHVTGIATGFTDLDMDTAGLQPSDLILVAARPSMGKTALALNMAEYMAFRDNKSVALFSLEMSKEQLVNRLFAMESRVEAQKIRTGDLQDADWDKLLESAEVIGASNMIIDDTPGISVAELRSKCRKYKMDHGLDAVFIDYLQLMSGGAKGHSSESRQQEISEISRGLKAVARELNVPVVALSQLSRAVESRPDRRPMLSDLRESGAIEQDADVVMFIYREDYYKKETERKGIADIIIAKQRNGPTGTEELLWIPEHTKFVNMQGNRSLVARDNGAM